MWANTMFRNCVAAFCILFVGAASAQTEGTAHVRRVAGVWTAYDIAGNSICAGAGSTYCIQELLDYARPLGLPAHVYGLGMHAPFDMTDTEIKVSAKQGTAPVYCHGCEFIFRNQVTGKNGFVFDTLMWSGFYNRGGSIRYCGSGSGVLMQPKTNLGVAWSHQHEYELGFVYGMSDCPVVGNALVRVDINQTCGTDQTNSSAFVNNHVTGFLRGSQKVQFNFRYDSPTCQYATGGENFFYFWDSTDAYNSEYYLGTYSGSALDVNIGTNAFIGNIAHTSALVGGYGIISNSSSDVWWLTSANIYNPGPSHLAYWGPHGCKNVILTMQAIPGSSGVPFANNCAAPNVNVIGPP